MNTYGLNFSVNWRTSFSTRQSCNCDRRRHQLAGLIYKHVSERYSIVVNVIIVIRLPGEHGSEVVTAGGQDDPVGVEAPILRDENDIAEGAFRP